MNLCKPSNRCPDAESYLWGQPCSHQPPRPRHDDKCAGAVESGCLFGLPGADADSLYDGRGNARGPVCAGAPVLRRAQLLYALCELYGGEIGHSSYHSGEWVNVWPLALTVQAHMDATYTVESTFCQGGERVMLDGPGVVAYIRELELNSPDNHPSRWGCEPGARCARAHFPQPVIPAHMRGDDKRARRYLDRADYLRAHALVSARATCAPVMLEWGDDAPVVCDALPAVCLHSEATLASAGLVGYEVVSVHAPPVIGRAAALPARVWKVCNPGPGVWYTVRAGRARGDATRARDVNHVLREAARADLRRGLGWRVVRGEW